MSSIVHFEYQPGIDDMYIREGHEYREGAFVPEAVSPDESVTVVTGMHNSHFDKRVLDVFPSLRLLVTRTVGTNHIDIEYLTAHGVEVFSVGQYGSHVIATHAVSLLLLGARDLIRSHEGMEDQGYSYGHLRPVDLSGKTVGIIGFGNIGRQIASMLLAFGMKILVSDPYVSPDDAKYFSVTPVPLAELYAMSDVLILACSLTESNKNMIDKNALERMKQGVIIINIARGELIDEDALLSNISKFSFVGLDVVRQETKEGVEKFASHKNVFITPHVAHLSDTTVAIRWDKTYRILEEKGYSVE